MNETKTGASLFCMSLFAAPISPVKDSPSGRIIRPATLKPCRVVTLQEVYQLITLDAQIATDTLAVRAALENNDGKDDGSDSNNSGNKTVNDAKAEYRRLKQERLPYVTPCGTFSYRNSQSLVCPSGLIVLDVDGLDSTKEAEELRTALFHDPMLNPALAFISPSGRGVKAFVPYQFPATDDVKKFVSGHIYWAMNYMQCTYGDGNPKSDKGVDISGKDIVRACFLSHDADALIREG